MAKHTWDHKQTRKQTKRKKKKWHPSAICGLIISVMVVPVDKYSRGQNVECALKKVDNLTVIYPKDPLTWKG